MKRFHFLFFVACFIFLNSFDFVNCASKCFSCAGFSCNTNLTVSCPTNTSYCQAITSTTAGIVITVKNCASTCTDGLSGTIGPTTVVYSCCTSDLCNSFVSTSGSISQFEFSGRLIGMSLLFSNLFCFILLK